MIQVINDSYNPYFNLALEEYLLKYEELKDTVLILWRNAPAVVVGKNQNTLEEINYPFVRDHQIDVVRRLSGGGAVYHDLGNLNFTLITDGSSIGKNDFAFFARPIIHCLQDMGVKAEFDGRNDITIDSKKFSGNAQYFYKNKILHHGTLLFDTNLLTLGQVLKTKNKYISKAVKSAASRVTNIRDHLDTKIDVNEFKSLLAQKIFAYNNCPYRKHSLSGHDLDKISKLVATKYGAWEWNYGASPQFNFKKESTFDAGTVSVNLVIEKGFIKKCKIYGDFFENSPVENLEDLLTGQKYCQEN
ncbi:MAG: lipoate--protein ligase, partial [Desulfotomaculaceae bacterium]